MSGADNVVEVGRALVDPLVTLWNSSVEILPEIIGAFLFAVFGYLVSKFIGYVVHNVLEKAGLDRWIKSIDRHTSVGHMSTSHILGGAVRWTLFSYFLVGAFGILDLGVFSQVLLSFANLIPKIVLGVLIVFAGMIVADVVQDKLDHAKRIGWIKSISPLIKFVIVLVFVFAALEQIDITLKIAEQTYLMLVGGLVLAVSIAVGIALGSALKPEASSAIKKIKKKL